MSPQGARGRPTMTTLGYLGAAVAALEIHGEGCGHSRVQDNCPYCDDRLIARDAKDALATIRAEQGSAPDGFEVRS